MLLSIQLLLILCLVIDEVGDIEVYFGSGENLVSSIGINGDEYCFLKK
jgi:hypothetical protein